MEIDGFKAYLMGNNRLDLRQMVTTTGMVMWECPSNIALIKYWGKKKGQVPLNPSISFTLKKSVTNVRVEYRLRQGSDKSVADFYFNGTRDKAVEGRVTNFIASISDYMPFLKQLFFEIYSENNFPHAAGIASSASGFGALALAFTNLEQRLFQLNPSESLFRLKASYLARLGSGSACRSVFGGFSIWGETPIVSGSSDLYAMPLNNLIHKACSNLCDSILIVHSGPKRVSSSRGHALMDDHFFRNGRIKQVQTDILRMLHLLESGDLSEFCKLVEYEALTLHALMMSSYPSYLLMTAETVKIIQLVREFRADTGLPLCFTLDAGANVHLIYPRDIEGQAAKLIKDELLHFCEEGKYIADAIGDGPVELLPLGSN